MKEKKIDIMLCRAVLMAFLPVLCCVVTCMLQGRGIRDVYLPGSEWNDELFYYKQVEGIVGFGYPQGFFGYNESHALKLSFGAWSPVLILPWVIWGLLFGWGLMSPVICNIVLMTIAVFAFVLLARPDRKQTGVLALLFCLYTPMTRYMLSGMPEILCISHLIVFYGLALAYQRRESAAKLTILFVIAGLLTLMRPYLFLFMLLPVYFWIRDARGRGKIRQGILGSAVVSCGVLAGYVLIARYFCAEYIAPLFSTDWLTAFFTRGFGAAARNLFATLYERCKSIVLYMWETTRSGYAVGACFAGYLVMMAVLVWQSVKDWGGFLREHKTQVSAQGSTRASEQAASGPGAQGSRAMLVAETHLTISFLGMLAALLLLYDLVDGSKHLLTFLAAGIFVVSMMETRFYKKAALIGAVFLYLYTYKATDPYGYRIPFREDRREALVREWQEIFDGNLEIDAEGAPNYENVVIWVFDEQDPRTGGHMEWRILYALPEGFGINCCQKSYVMEHFEELNSRYMVVCAGTETDSRCRSKVKLAENDGVVLYQLH